MPIQPIMSARIRDGQAIQRLRPKYGDEIVAGTDYPSTWDGFIGQVEAVEQLRAAVKAALHLDRRLDHILLASGAHGIGKTTLAQIVACQLGTGFIGVSGALSVDEARTIISSMRNGDVLFWDEFHLAVAGNKNRADWLLPMLTDHVLLTKRGTEPMPDITIIAATTDVGKLPQTVISRFMIRPRLDYYTLSEGVLICQNLAARMKINIIGNDSAWSRIATAADNNPRTMRQILTAVQNIAITESQVDLDKAFKWAGVTHDGLTDTAVDMLLVLIGSPNFTASLETIQASLGEPGPLRHHEQLLLQKGLIQITGRGRALTEAGVERVSELVLAR